MPWIQITNYHESRANICYIEDAPSNGESRIVLVGASGENEESHWRLLEMTQGLTSVANWPIFLIDCL